MSLGNFKIYNALQSTCSQRVRYTLHHKKIDFSMEILDLFSGDQLKPEYLAINPNGVVPALDHDGKIIIDSSQRFPIIRISAKRLPHGCRLVK